ncbi:hypothetical protein KP509_18G051200 [Ceratopteris richardii]|uniref:UBP-type domain-containing protein n=1 Tax=Ceratopteris richardii TaxID=49495 RepID=A0A8T2SPI1_CERRI|nr:hypothetical protein KP509_18G051200 [Ceratopteris richardii]KAH7365881.1 hypothetical protein KP509_18G051200 [Ceratopteris richardii]
MAASSSAATPSDMEGYSSGYVLPLTYCPHLPAELPFSPSSCPDLGMPCHRCGSFQENWVCLVCQIVGCGRYINGDMLAHSQSTDHAVAMSFSDLSVWCFKCDAYLDAEAIHQLRSIFTLIYTKKFGESPPQAHQSS